jgi:hypothetical protein
MRKVHLAPRYYPVLIVAGKFAEPYSWALSHRFTLAAFSTNEIEKFAGVTESCRRRMPSSDDKCLI